MKKGGIASLIIAMGGKSKGGSEGPEEESDDVSAAAGDIWDAIKADDKEAFVDAVKSYSTMCQDDE